MLQMKKNVYFCPLNLNVCYASDLKIKTWK
jgi:hypothetical protein